jgi:uncharacterized protein (TIGR03437 family)
VSLSIEGATISSLQFDLEWDAGLGVQMAVGSGLTPSGKLLYTTQLTARSVRFLMSGVDPGVMADGELLRLFVAAGLSAGSFQVRVTNAIGATPDGSAIPIQTSPATITVTSGTPGAAILPESVLNAASLLPGAIAPGEIVTLLGVFGLDSSNKVVATVNGTSATVLYALGNQINAVAPWSLGAGGPADVSIRNADRQLARIVIPVEAASPAVFTQGGTGIGPGAILNQDYSLNSASNPAPAGSVVMIFGTGFGSLIPPAIDGTPGVLSATALPVIARIGSLPADVLYAGAAPDLPNGVVQINLRIPAGLTPKSTVPLELRVGSFDIPSGVTIAVR